MTPVTSLPPAHVVDIARPPVHTISQASGWTTYVVRAGDTLWDVATRTGTTVSELVARNGLSSAAVSLHVGDRIAVPVGGTATGSAGASGGSAAAGRSYVVRAGDSVWDVASSVGIDADALLAANGLTATSTILPGQRLTIPSPGSGAAGASTGSTASRSTSTYGTYVVRPGDTAWDIAARLGVDTDALLAANGLTGHDVLLPGKRLTLPGGQAAARASTKAARTDAADTGATTVTVRDGDTLWDIASRFGVSVTSLAKANGIDLDHALLPGDRLRVVGSVASSAATTTSTSAVSSSASANLAYLNSTAVPTRTQIRSMIVSTAQAHGLDPRLALAIAWQESRWTQRAVSEANAVGVMQCLPSTAEWVGSLIGRRLDVLSTQDNITCGVVLLRSLTRSTSSESEAIAAYYQGLTSLRTRGPYGDTADYVASVLAYKQQM